MNYLQKDLFICKQCELVSSNISPDPSIYDRSYEIKYSRYENTLAGARIQELRRQAVLDVIGFKSNRQFKLLDFGCGVGSFIKAIADIINIKSSGFDINPYTQYCDISVLFDDYDIVTMWDSIEHLKNPITIIKKLDPEILVVCTPSTDDCMGDLIRWRHYMPVEHCHYFNELSLVSLFKACGYRLFRINYSESGPRHGGGEKNILTMSGVKGG